MAVLTMTDEEITLREAAGTRAFLMARDHVIRGELHDLQGSLALGHLQGRVGSGSGAHTALALVERSADGSTARMSGSCTCGVGPLCRHATALLLARLTGSSDRAGTLDVAVSSPAARRPARPAWERVLGALLTPASPTRSSADTAAAVEATLALQFEVTGGAVDSAIVVRPVVPGRGGGWVRSGISWDSLAYSGYSGFSGYSGYSGRGLARWNADHVRLLLELQALHGHGHSVYYGRNTTVELGAIGSRRVWDLLVEAQQSGLPLVQSGRRAAPVIVHPESARAEVDLSRTGDQLIATPRLSVAGHAVAADEAMLIGEPAHGLAWWSAPTIAHRADRADRVDPVLVLAPLRGTLDPSVMALLSGGTLAIPERDQERFLSDVCPVLRHRVDVVTDDPSVPLPTAEPPVLGLTVTGAGDHRVHLVWDWRYREGRSIRSEPLWAATAGAPSRDEAAQARLVGAVAEAGAGLEELFEVGRFGLRLAPEAALHGMTTVRFFSEVLPRWNEMADVEVRLDLDGAPPEYRESDASPVITFAGQGSSADNDWFDLAVTVTVAGEDVPFQQLFLALAREEPYLILPSGTYFGLDREEFARLAALIAESRELDDAPSGAVRLNRYQATRWAEVEEIGEITGQAVAWRDAVTALLQAEPRVPDLPEGVQAVLRPYQQAGFGWLAALFEHRLGGVLADDMGLGKTVQALVLMAHARRTGLATAPFLVVAPTSVVGNWAREAARFTPDASVVTIGQTQARRGAPVPEVAAGADIVITSYTLFRLEFDQYQGLDWAGLLLDEAQNVKNHQSVGYRCARTLDTPFKLAITGTPMENNLMELWSLLSITAPGLFASARRFTEYYRTPIERDRDPDRLAQLRRRIRPLLLRRGKDQVAADLPDKQEQVVDLDLDPRHRKVYQTYLQRERRKVLGLLDDLQQNRFEIFRSLTLLRQASLHVGLIDKRHHQVPSTKLDALMTQIESLAAEGHRVLVYSQFTRFLAHARERLDASGIDYCYLDGSTTRRDRVVERFRTGSAPVFLISLKAGGVGLNLVEADYVIVLDPWWNPATEAQAVDRAHRIGQTRKVMVYRLVARDTVEDKVMALKARKAELIGSVLEDGDFGSARLTADDIRGLLE